MQGNPGPEWFAKEAQDGGQVSPGRCRGHPSGIDCWPSQQGVTAQTLPRAVSSSSGSRGPLLGTLQGPDALLTTALQLNTLARAGLPPVGPTPTPGHSRALLDLDGLLKIRCQHFRCEDFA